MRHPFITPRKFEGYFKDPYVDEQFAMSMGSLVLEIEDNFGRVAAASNISLALPATQDSEDIETSVQEFLAPIQTNSRDAILPRSVIVGFHGSMSEARNLRGWAVCDGDDGTPDLLNRYLKWGAENEDSGVKGGSLTHKHVVLIETDIASHCGNDVSTSTPDVEASDQSHTHSVSGETNTANHEPPYFTLIPIMKR